ncbi:MAG: glycosyltransferase family 4 protein [Acidobacteriota bacterium]
MHRYTEDCVKTLSVAIGEEQADIFSPNCFLPGYYSIPQLSEAGVSSVGVLHADEAYYHDLVDLSVLGRPEWRFSGLVTVSEFLKRWMDKCCPEEIQRVHAPCGVPVANETARPAEKEFRIIYCGRLIERQKRIHRLLDRVRSAVTLIPGVTATFYGDGPELAEITTRIAGLNLGSCLRYGGVLDVDDVMTTMSSAHAFVLLSDFEGLSIALLEAMTCGLVPIAVRTRSGTDEVLRHGENALIVDPADEDGFVSAVRRLRADPETWQRLSRAAQRTVTELGLTSDNCAKRWAGLCERLRAGRPRPDWAFLQAPRTVQLPPLSWRPDGVRRGDRRSPAQTLLELARDQRPVYLWGAGGAGRAALPRLLDMDLRILGFIDSSADKRGAEIDGFRVFAPEIVQADQSVAPPFVLITSMYVDEIAARLESLGLRRAADYLDY